MEFSNELSIGNLLLRAGTNEIVKQVISKCWSILLTVIVIRFTQRLPYLICFRGSHDCAVVSGLHDVLIQASIDLPSSYVWLCKSCKESSVPIASRKRKTPHDSVNITDPAILARLIILTLYLLRKFPRLATKHWNLSSRTRISTQNWIKLSENGGGGGGGGGGGRVAKKTKLG